MVCGRGKGRQTKNTPTINLMVLYCHYYYIERDNNWKEALVGGGVRWEGW